MGLKDKIRIILPSYKPRRSMKPIMKNMNEITMMRCGVLKCWNLALFTSSNETPLSHDHNYLKTSRGSQWSHIISACWCGNRGETRGNPEMPLCNCHNRPLPLPLEASFRSKLLYLSHPYKGDNCTRKRHVVLWKFGSFGSKLSKCSSCSSRVHPFLLFHTHFRVLSSYLFSLLSVHFHSSQNQKHFRGYQLVVEYSQGIHFSSTRYHPLLLKTVNNSSDLISYVQHYSPSYSISFWLLLSILKLYNCHIK